MPVNNIPFERMRSHELLRALPFFLALFALTLSFYRPSVSLIPSMAGPGEMPYYYLAFFGLLYFLAFFMVITLPKPSWRVLTNHWSYLAFLAFIILSSLWSTYPIEVIKKSTHYIGLLLLSTAAIVALLRKEKSMLRMFVAYTSISIIICLATVIMSPSRGIEAVSHRWMGMTSHPNVLGSIAMLAIWANINYLFYTRSYIERAWSVIILGLSAVCLYGSNSITATVVSVLLVVFVPIMMWFDKRNIARTLLMVGAIAVPTLITLAIFMISTGQSLHTADIVDEFFAITGRDKNLTGRTTLWEIAWSAFNQKPLLGWSFDDLMSFLHVRHLRHSQFHNGYLDLLVRGGIVGAVFMGYLILRKYFLFVRLARVNWRLFVTLASLSTAILVHNLTEATLVKGQHILSVLFVFVLFYLNRGNINQPRNDLPNNKTRNHVH